MSVLQYSVTVILLMADAIERHDLLVGIQIRICRNTQLLSAKLQIIFENQKQFLLNLHIPCQYSCLSRSRNMAGCSLGRWWWQDRG